MRLLPFALFLAGCPASVTAEGLDDGFGMPISALRTHVVGNDGDADYIILSNVGDLCTKETDFWDAYTAYMTAATDVLSQNYCKNLETPMTDFVEAAQAMQFKGATYVTLSVGSDFDEGEYGFDEEASGSVSSYDDTPYEGAIDDFDPDGGVMDGCGMGTVDTDEGNYWELANGSVKLDSVVDEGVTTGSADGTMKTDSGKDDGDFQASFSASWCEIKL